MTRKMLSVVLVLAGLSAIGVSLADDDKPKTPASPAAQSEPSTPKEETKTQADPESAKDGFLISAKDQFLKTASDYAEIGTDPELRKLSAEMRQRITEFKARKKLISIEVKLREVIGEFPESDAAKSAQRMLDSVAPGSDAPVYVPDGTFKQSEETF